MSETLDISRHLIFLLATGTVIGNQFALCRVRNFEIHDLQPERGVQSWGGVSYGRIQPRHCCWILFFTCFPRAEQATTLCWTTAQMGADSNISNYWGSLTASRPLGNPWFMICSSHSMLISSPLGAKFKANNAVSLSAEAFVGERSKSDWSEAQISEVLCPIPRWCILVSS